jgi:hypothetical protein
VWSRLIFLEGLQSGAARLKAGLMSGSRKLQTEIDKALKKIGEGVDLFDEIWDKVGCHAKARRSPDLN